MAVLSTSHLPAIYQHGTARINWVLTCYPLIVFFSYAFLRCGSSDAPMLTTSTARMMQSEATASISTHS